MRVLHVYKDYAPVVGGMENHIRLLAEAQARQGHDVTVLVTSQQHRSNSEVIGGVRVVRAARLFTLSSAPVSLSLFGELRAAQPDVTHLHSPYPVGEAAWLAGGRPPLIVTYQSDIVRQRFLGTLWSPWLRRLLASADRILASSPRYAETSPFLQPNRERVEVVPLGIEPDRFRGIDRQAARARLAPIGDRPLLAFVGRLRYYKGLHVLLEALALLPDVGLLVAGTGAEGKHLHRQAEQLGVERRVIWLGDVSEEDLPLVYASCDLFVLPSTARSEAYGLVLLEAMAAGRPVISTELGTGTSWINEDGVTGRVVPPGDPNALAEAARLLLSDPQMLSDMGRAASQRVDEKFTADRMVEHIETIYEEVVR